MAELDLQIDGRVARLTLQRPKARNALSPSLLEGVVERCGELASNEDVHVVVLRGNDGVFSAGADVMGFMQLIAKEGEAGADLGRRAAEALARLPQVTIALIEGHCVGGGVVLAGACDLRWATPDAWFRVPELELGIPFAWGAMERFVSLVGDTMAAELALTARRFDAQDAARIGFVGNVAPLAALEEAVREVASRPAVSLRATKHQLRGLREGSFDPSEDAQALVRALHDPEVQKAAQAYLARRVRAKR